MPKLVEPQNTVGVLKKYNFTFSKRYGQNFLVDPLVLSKIIRASGVGPDDAVLEIGPGIGTLTEGLSEAAGHVFAVEIDSALIPILEDTLSACDNVTVIHGDILKTDLRALSEEQAGGKPFKVVANLPYYITTPIILKLLQEDLPVTVITVMVQKEVAERMQAGPGTKDYGALSLAVQYYAEPYLAANVPQNCFMPRPDVASAVIRLTKRQAPAVAVRDPEQMFRIIRASFNQRRKTLVNGLKNADSLEYTKEELEQAFALCGLDPMVRGETLTLERFAALSDAL
ncbi:MAG: 16S rRNA (adenine(1518)-N(6)/adenine(1519)-N(6))-dimethyltransferase RsmA, partial [Lachnospiraceae bacterium]|nr:16S rRNA (adenine(1518)-N(6)/adenine(1519)-N(6))-dimethyltransferase RsmA [Lachnospiraceae bacterium]